VRICSGAGCLRAIADDVRYCDECRPTPVVVDDGIREHTTSDRERYRRLYSSPRWQRLRLQAIRACPMCARCNAAITEIVDHIVPAGVAVQQVRDSGLYPTDRFAGFYVLWNLQGLCRACHWLKTNEDKLHTGSWPSVVDLLRRAKQRTYSF
jgi:5-methylcytosine-specific restriction enzyme A